MKLVGSPESRRECSWRRSVTSLFLRRGVSEMPASLSELEEGAARQLREAGYPLVQVGARRLAGQTLSPAYVLAWGPNLNDEVVPAVLVGVEASSPESSERMRLAWLAARANTFGTLLNYLFDGEWRRASHGFERLTDVDGPARAKPMSDTSRPSAELIAYLAELHFGAWPRDWDAAAVARLVSRTAAQVTSDVRALWKRSGVAGVLEALRALTRRGPLRSVATPLPVAEAMARLLDLQDDETVMDPICRAGSLLWATLAEAQLRGQSVTLSGSSDAEGLIDIANALARLTGTEGVRFQLANWFLEEGGGDSGGTHLVSDLPIGRDSEGWTFRPSHPLPLPWDNANEDTGAFVLFRVADELRSGRRAVVLTSRAVLQRGGNAAMVRNWIQENRRVVALIGLPTEAYPTSVRPVLLVIENAPHTRTLVAELQDDWLFQLGPDGEFLHEYRRHLRP